MNHLKGQLTLVTGGASGIGKLTAQELAALGARVRIWDLNAQALADLEDWGRANDLDLRGEVCDIGDRAEVYRRAEALQAAEGPLDLLVNNAGIVSGRPLLETSDEQIEKTLAVNTLALFWTAKAFLPGMLSRGTGHIVTVASAAGLIGVRGLVDYSASKFAAVGFDEALRMELVSSRSGVRTTLVCPFFIDTGMFAGVQTRFPLLLPILKPEKVARRIVRAIVCRQRRVILPAFVRSVLFLRPLPVRVFDTVAALFGINHSMDHFTGRNP